MAANKLQLQVILSALDKATAPLKRIQGGGIGAGKALKEARDRLKELNAQQKDVSAWRTQRAAAEATQQALGAARERVKQLSREFAATGAPTRQMTQNMQAAVREATNLKRQHSEQQTQLQGLRNKLNAAGISTRQLGQGERDLRAKIAATNAEMTKQEARLKSITAQQKRLAAAKSQYEKTQSFAGSMAGTGASAAAAGAAMGMPVLSVVKDYMSFEDAMAGVAKQVAGARDDNGQLTSTYYQMADSIKAMAERIPMATTELAALVEGAARMGVEGTDDLLKFTEVAANAATAFELPADEISENLARIADLYKIPIKNVDELGDAINYLDDQAKSKGADIIEMLQRTAGITASVGMSYKDSAALGSTFLTLGASAEVASTATNAMIRELAIATQQPKRFGLGLKALGIEAQALQDNMSGNATETLMGVLDAINALPKNKQLEVATQLFGKEFGDDASKLAQNMGEYRRQLALANSEAGKGSMQREADIRAELLSARLEMAQNRAFNLTSALGESLRPQLLGLFESFNKVVEGVTGWVKANPELTGQILKTVAGLAMLATGFGAVTLGMASLLGPFAMVRYGMTLLGIKGLPLVGLLVKLGKVGLPLVATGLRMLAAAAMANPILALITGIALGATLIYSNWDTIGPYFAGLWAEIKQGFSGGISGIAATIINFSPAGLFYRAFADVLNWLGFELPVRFTEMGGMLLDGLVSGITGKLGAVRDAISSVADSTIGWFKEKLDIHSPSRVFAQLGNFTMQGLGLGLAGGENDVLKQIASTARSITDTGANMLGIGSSLNIERPTLQAAPQTVMQQDDAMRAKLAALRENSASANDSTVLALGKGLAASANGMFKQIASTARSITDTGANMLGIGSSLNIERPTLQAAPQTVMQQDDAMRAKLAALRENSASANDSTVLALGKGLAASANGMFKQIASTARSITDTGANMLGIGSSLNIERPTLQAAPQTVMQQDDAMRAKLAALRENSASANDSTVLALGKGLAASANGMFKQIASTARSITDTGAKMLGIGSSLNIDSRPPISAGAGAGMVVQGDTYQITIQATPGTDTASLQQMINRLLDERERNKASRMRASLRDQE